MHPLRYYDESDFSSALTSRYGEYLQHLPPACILRLVQTVAGLVEHGGNLLENLRNSFDLPFENDEALDEFELIYLEIAPETIGDELPEPSWLNFSMGLISCLQCHPDY